jgi:hypothetical protein
LEQQFDQAHQNYVDKTDQQNKEFKVCVCVCVLMVSCVLLTLGCVKALEKADLSRSKRIRKKRQLIENLTAKLAGWKKKHEHNVKALHQHTSCSFASSAIFLIAVK